MNAAAHESSGDSAKVKTSLGAARGFTPYVSSSPRLEVGRIVEYEGRFWRVGLVNFSRARLDPLTGASVKPSPVSGRCFTSYGDSVNVGPTSLLPAVDMATLDEAAQRRLARLLAAEQERESLPALPPDEENDDMSENVGAVSAAPVPRGGKKGRAAQRAAKLAKPPKNGATPLGQKKERKAAKEKVAKEQRACMCGCGQMTTGYFVPGHDARFKSWLLNIERGNTALHGQDLKEGQERTPLPKKVQEQFKWVRRGDGWIPTTNYKGEKHEGYDR